MEFDTPARGLYARLSEELTGEGIASLRVKYRHPTILDEAVADVLAGTAFLEMEGVESLAVLGHSFGGAVVIQVASMDPSVRTVVTLATQSYGTEMVHRLGPSCSILLLHGTADRVLPPSSSRFVFDSAREPRAFILYDGAGHGLDETADEIYQEVRNWITEKLKAAAA